MNDELVKIDLVLNTCPRMCSRELHAIYCPPAGVEINDSFFKQDSEFGFSTSLYEEEDVNCPIKAPSELHPHWTYFPLVGGGKGKKKKKNNNNKKGQAAKYTTRVGRPYGFVAPRMTNYLHYGASIQLSSTVAGAVTSYTYRANSLFDPDLTGTGTQPTGFDQCAEDYNRYLVRKCWYEIWFPGIADGMQYVVLFNNGAPTVTITTLADFDYATTLQYSKFTMTSYSGSPVGYLKGSVDLATLNGSTRTRYETDDRFQATTTSNPTEDLRIVIGAYNSGGITQTGRFKINITYASEFFDPIQPIASYRDSRSSDYLESKCSFPSQIPPPIIAQVEVMNPLVIDNITISNNSVSFPTKK